MKRKISAAIIFCAVTLLMAATACVRAESKRLLASYLPEDGEYALEVYEASPAGEDGGIRLVLKRGASSVAELDCVEYTGDELSVYWLDEMVQLLSGNGSLNCVLRYDGRAFLCEGPGLEKEMSACCDNGRLCFSLKVDEYLEQYNSLRETYHCEKLPLTADGWVYGEGFASPLDGEKLERFTYKENIDNGLEPELALYTDPETGLLQLAAIGFENHGYTQWGTRLSKERSFFALKTLLNLEEDKKAWEIFEKVYVPVRLAENYTVSGASPAILELYVYEDKGIFSYFSSGVAWLCIGPVNELQLSQLELSGTRLIRL